MLKKKKNPMALYTMYKNVHFGRSLVAQWLGLIVDALGMTAVNTGLTENGD